MNRDPVIDLLRRADAAAPRPVLDRDLATRIRRRLIRRRTLTVTAALLSCSGAAAVVLIAIRLAAVPTNPAPSAPGNSVPALASTEIAQLRREIDALNREAEVRHALLTRTDELLRQARSPKRNGRPPTDDPLRTANSYVETAACLAVQQAERLEANGLTAAVAAYRDVVEILPQALCTEEARRRLELLSGAHGGS